VIFAPYIPSPASSRTRERARRLPLVTKENSKGSPFSWQYFLRLVEIERMRSTLRSGSPPWGYEARGRQSERCGGASWDNPAGPV